MNKLWYYIKKLNSFFSGYYNILLTLLILLFIFRPYSSNLLYLGIWKFFFSLALFSAVFNCNHNKKVVILSFFLAVPTVILTWLNLFHDHVIIFILNVALTILLLFICAFSIIVDVVLRARVTLDTLRGAICAYFLVAFFFAYIYYLIAYLQPNAFHFAFSEMRDNFYTYYLSEMLYFSAVTIVTLGYGDVTPATEFGKTIAALQGIFGQFYLAILVSRLVSVYTYAAYKGVVTKIEKDIGVK